MDQFLDMPGKKDDLAASLSKISEKLERKRQKKLEKKLAKQQQQELNPKNATAEQKPAEVKADAVPEKVEKKLKVKYFFN